MGFLSLNAQILETEMEKVSYSLGVSVANSVKAQGLQSIDAKAVGKAFEDVFEGKELVISEEEANVILQEYFQKLANKALEENQAAGKEFLIENAKRDGVVTTASGLQYEVLVQGSGASPKEQMK